ncbi:phage tail protein [Methylobacterium gnaphalii]|uniref:Uncharacterized protein n=1 Tax=Methylobacterium gnaphalii TaxID=1010610 RepID=A0A512JPE5_9HYPH|nr:phage tail protein [Methylobacterium gnaphalii]GEP11821.1 hypothetical protein MGN01_36660 [Methylobacterium gnaphalii]GJD69405.1 hypothetical protein MMMDOFMJ_2336 [Methylobacterium gnaphalii]GLS49544.1 hypothetical protein GCM10007885_23930 [Methylobacterium gnaphalii]
MSEDLVPTITRAGLAACRNAQGSGLLATIAAVAIGRGVVSGSNAVGYSPTGAETALKSEITRVPLLSGSQIGSLAGSDPLGFRVLAEVPAAATGTPPAPINEVGWFLSDGTLLCLWSSATYPLGFLTDKASLELAHDLFLSQLPVASMAITVTRPDLPDTLPVLARLCAAGQRALADKARAFVRAFTNA